MNIGIGDPQPLGWKIMKKSWEILLISVAFGAFALHVIASTRWLVIHLTRGNRKTIPVDLNEAFLFFGLLLVLGTIGWFSRAVRTQHGKSMAIATGLNLMAFLFSGSLLLMGVVEIIRL